jgi:hypothetical protein
VDDAEAPQLAARFGWTDQYQVLQASSDRRRAPQRLLAWVITGYAEGVLPAQAIATLRGISLEAGRGASACGVRRRRPSAAYWQMIAARLKRFLTKFLAAETTARWASITRVYEGTHQIRHMVMTQ